MEFKILKTKHNGLCFKIEEDYPEVGTYLYVFNNGKCIRDTLQNSIEICKEIAKEEYNVSIDSWKEADS